MLNENRPGSWLTHPNPLYASAMMERTAQEERAAQRDGDDVSYEHEPSLAVSPFHVTWPVDAREHDDGYVHLHDEESGLSIAWCPVDLWRQRIKLPYLPL